MFDVIGRNFWFLMGGLWVTLKLSVFALSGGIFLGMLVGLARLSKNPWIYYPVTAYVNLLRNIPLILVIFWFYFVMPILVGRAIDPFPSAVISFIVFEATYFGEIFRAGYQTISQDQIAASYSTGMTYWKTARYISIPIAFRRMLPSLITQSIVTFQDTSLAFVIGLRELFAALVYLTVCYLGSLASQYYEKQGRKVNII
jgi:glutamate/aspartate transport system permease protein